MKTLINGMLCFSFALPNRLNSAKFNVTVEIIKSTKFSQQA